MKQSKLLWGFGLAVPLLLFACGGDDEEDDDGGGTGGTSGSGGSMNVECDPAGDGVCENDTDCPEVESGNARSSAQECGLGCLQDPDQETCAVECIVTETGITTECAGCYAATVQCASENCLAECAGNPAGAACTNCQVEAGCRSDFDSCSGLGD